MTRFKSSASKPRLSKDGKRKSDLNLRGLKESNKKGLEKRKKSSESNERSQLESRRRSVPKRHLLCKRQWIKVMTLTGLAIAMTKMSKSPTRIKTTLPSHNKMNSFSSQKTR